MTSFSEEGSPDRPYCLVGEAPSFVEYQTNRPFSGPAGQVADSCLHAAGIARGECYILNLWGQRVSKNDKTGEIYTSEGIYYTPRSGITELGYIHAKQMFTRLDKFVGKVVVPLGGPATEAITKKRGILKWRGSPLVRPGTEQRCVPTIHPAATLRGAYLWRYHIISDLRKAKRVVAGAWVPDRTYRLAPEFEEVEDFIGRLHNQPRFSFDIEVYNHQVSCFSLCSDPMDVISVPLINVDGGQYWTEAEEVTIWQMLAELLADETKEIIGQNLIFDTWFLLDRNHIFTRGKLLDTMIAHHIMYPDFEKGLDFLCSLYSMEPYYKDDRKLWDKITEDPYTFWRYNAKDAAVTMEVWNAIEAELMGDPGFLTPYRQTIDLFPILTYFQLRGIQVDRGMMRRTKLRIEAELNHLYSELDSRASYPFNPLSPKQCIEYFYSHKGIKPYISRKTGNPTCDDKALQRIVRRYRLPEASLCQQIRAREKIKGTYLEIVLDGDDRLRASYNPRGTKFARLSSSATVFGTGTNMQNIPADLREFLVCDGDSEGPRDLGSV